MSRQSRPILARRVTRHKGCCLLPLDSCSGPFFADSAFSEEKCTAPRIQNCGIATSTRPSSVSSRSVWACCDSENGATRPNSDANRRLLGVSCKKIKKSFTREAEGWHFFCRPKSSNSMNKEFSLPLVVLSLFLVPLAIRANDIEPGKEKYNAIPRTQTITIDGNMSDWDTTKFWKDTKFYIPKGSGSNSTTATNLVSFEPYGSGTAGQDHQSVSFGIVWDADNLYIGLVVGDDYHENAAKSEWNGDSLQMAFTDATRSTITQLYNIALGGTDDAPGSIGDIPVTDVNEQYSGCGLTVSNDWFVVR